MDLYEKTIESKFVFQGKMIGVKVEKVLLPDGKEAFREVVAHPGAVAVVALNEDREVILVRQYRKPIEQETLEIPAGKLEPGEDSYSCALRELREETGYFAEKMEHIIDFYTTPGFTDENMHLFLATSLKLGESQPDGDEFIQVVTLPFAEALRNALSGKYPDAKTVLGLLAAEKKLQQKGLAG